MELAWTASVTLVGMNRLGKLMTMLEPEKTQMPARGRPAGPQRAGLRGARDARRARHAAGAAVPGRDRGRLLRARLLLGRRAALLGPRRRLHDGGRLPERDHAEPDLRGGLLGQDRPRRGGPGRLRPGARSPTPTCSRSSSRSTTRPRGCARATTSAPSTARASTSTTTRRRRRRRWRGTPTTPSLRAAGHEPITTEIEPAGPFYYAEDHHQQYLHKVPNGYCGLAGTGVSCRIPAAAA